MLGTSDRRFELATMTINFDAGLAKDACFTPETEQPDVCAAVHRYLDASLGVVEEADDLLLFVFDPKMGATTDASARRLVSAARYPRIAEAYEALTGVAVSKLHTFVVVGKGFAETNTLDVSTMRSLAAADVAHILNTLFPIESEGPISGYMPWMVQIAGSIILPGADPDHAGEFTDKAASASRQALEARIDKAVARAFDHFATYYYDEHWNKLGLVQTNYPAFLPLASAVGRKAAEIASDVDAPLPRDMAMRSMLLAITQAVREFDVTVDTRRASH